MSLVKKIGLGLASLVALAVVGALLFVWWIGAWGILFPSHAHETTPPVLAADFGANANLRVLVYSKTNQFRHTEGIAASHDLFDELATDADWAVFHTENSAVFDSTILDRFDVVVFASASGDHASDAQDAAFRRWLEEGGGWLGIHAAGDGSHAEWTWYEETLKTGTYLGHILGPQTQEARVVVEDPQHPVTTGLPADFVHAEEWYSWDRGAREAGYHVLLTVDESTYSPWIRGMGQEVDISMGDHPIVWSRCVDRGRAVYTAMGHWAEAYARDYTKTLLRNAVAWAGDPRKTECEGTPRTASR
ncbi:MAG: ThuA domain-containing protein [bacterium]|nr:ThuA domain-containing protein [bacterium]